MQQVPDIEFYINAAHKHGEYSDPDHEVGDLQTLLRALWSLQTPEQRTTFIQLPMIQMMLDGAYAHDEPTWPAPLPITGFAL